MVVTTAALSFHHKAGSVLKYKICLAVLDFPHSHELIFDTRSAHAYNEYTVDLMNWNLLLQMVFQQV